MNIASWIRARNWGFIKTNQEVKSNEALIIQTKRKFFYPYPYSRNRKNLNEKRFA